jgi:hypothetical protein
MPGALPDSASCKLVCVPTPLTTLPCPTYVSVCFPIWQPGYWTPLPGRLLGSFIGCAVSAEKACEVLGNGSSLSSTEDDPCNNQKCAPGHHGNLSDYKSPTCAGLCPKGHYCESGSPVPLPCPPGTSMRVKGNPSRESCAACGAGQFNNKPGADRCNSCPAGRFNEQTNQTACTACPQGGEALALCPKAVLLFRLPTSCRAPCPHHTALTFPHITLHLLVSSRQVTCHVECYLETNLAPAVHVNTHLSGLSGRLLPHRRCRHTHGYRQLRRRHL